MKKKVVFISACIAAFSILTGCREAELPKDQEAKEGQKDMESEAKKVGFDQPLPHDYEGTLTMWGWDEAYYETVTKAFREHYPNVTFEYFSVEHKDLPQKYETALITGSELPDIAWAVVDSRARVFELDMWEPLEQAPYNFAISDVYEYLHPHMVNARGNVCGIEQSLSPAGLAYRKDLAKQYLGTDDPQELEAMLPDWDAFIEKGKEVFRKSQGQVYMWSGLDDIRQFTQEQQGKSWVLGEAIDVEGTFGRPIELVCRFRDEYIADELITWTPAWYAAFGEDRHIFSACATWSIAFTIESNDPEGKESGHWGLMNAPEGNVNWGGTSMGIAKTCKDKRLAWEFLKFATMSVEGAKALNSLGLLTTAKKPYEEKPELKSYRSCWFGEQDLGVYFLEEIVPNVTTRKLKPEDMEIHDSLSLITVALSKDRDMTAPMALELLKRELRKELPDYAVF